MTRRVQVVVLGDWGRSPRMQHHAVELSRQAGLDVDVLAYAGAAPCVAAAADPRIVLRPLAPTPRVLSCLPRALALPLKALWLAVSLMWALMWAPRPEYILLQLPPSLPALTACRLAAWLRGASLILDWHNLGHTLLELSLFPPPPAPQPSLLARLPRRLLVMAATAYEQLGARGGVAAHLTVSQAMGAHLTAACGIRAPRVLPDRPPPHFAPAKMAAAHELFTKLGGDITGGGKLVSPRGTPRGRAALAAAAATAGTTLFTCMSCGLHASLPMWRPGRPALVVTSTSWTPDEDIGIALDAMAEYARRARAGIHPRVCLVVTGRGPLRARYEPLMAELTSSHAPGVTAAALWLPAAEYPTLLGAADVGLSLHASSSGLDLPMKAVDMLGCGLPVVALRYPAITELVVPGVNGALVHSAGGLATELLRLLAGFDGAAGRGGGAPALAALYPGAAAEGRRRWAAEWARVARPLFC